MHIKSFSPLRSTLETHNNINWIKSNPLHNVTIASPEVMSMFEKLNNKVIIAKKSRFEGLVSPKILKIRVNQNRDLTSKPIKIPSWTVVNLL